MTTKRILIQSIDQSEGSEWYEMITLPESEIDLLRKFLKDLNDELENSEDPSIEWDMLVLDDNDVVFQTAMEVAEHIHMSDGTGQESIDEIYKTLIRLYFDDAYNKSTLPEEE